MNKVRDDEDDGVIMSLSDFKLICKKTKKKILIGAAICAVIGSFYALTRPILYSTEASFREKAKTDSGSRTITSVILGSSNQESAAITTIKSRKIMEPVVKKLGQQGVITLRDRTPGLFKKVVNNLSLIKKNLKVEYAYFRGWTIPALKDVEPTLYLADIVYDGELMKPLEIEFTSDATFKVVDPDEGELGLGSLGVPFVGADFRFVLNANEEGSYSGQVYDAAIFPLSKMAEGLAGSVKVTNDFSDKSFLRLTLQHSNRQGVSKILNTVMESYREYMIQEHHRVVADQIAYLKQRQEEMDQNLVKLMEEHAEHISTTGGNLELLTQTQQGFRKRLLTIDLEMKHLQKALEEGSCFYERYSSEADPVVIHNTMGEIRRYKQQSDSIDILLRNNKVYDKKAQKEAFEQHLVDLQNVRLCNAEAKKMLASLESDKLPPPSQVLFEAPQYMVKTWYEKLADSDKNLKMSTSDQKPSMLEEKRNCQNGFTSYLANLVHLLEVHEKTIQDRLVHQQKPQLEFQGIDLDTSNSLYLTYSKELHQIEAEIAQNEFIIEQIQNPNFEISSLTTVLTDAVSRDLIGKASSVALTIKDESNRTQRELERLRQELDLHRGFLRMHLQQIIQLAHLREELLRSKIGAIQNVTLELIQQKVSILEKHLADYTASRINNLKHEQEVILQQQQELNRDLDKIPQQWATEKLVDLHLQSIKSMLQEISSMIESKNIADNLEVSLSAPVDPALPPLLPNPPRLLAYTMLGAFAGGFMALFFAVMQSVVQGVPVSADNLRFSGKHVAGKLSKIGNTSSEGIPDTDLETLRRLSAYLCPPEAFDGIAVMQPRTMLLLIGSGLDYSEDLAELMSKRGLRVLVMPISFDAQPEKADLPGLLQYLEGQADQPKIIKGKWFDRIVMGGVSRYSNELVESKAFKLLINKLSVQYDWIIAVSKASPVGAEAESLLSAFDCAAICVSDEKLHDLKPCFKLSDSGKKITFVL